MFSFSHNILIAIEVVGSIGRIEMVRVVQSCEGIIRWLIGITIILVGINRG